MREYPFYIARLSHKVDRSHRLVDDPYFVCVVHTYSWSCDRRFPVLISHDLSMWGRNALPDVYPNV